MQRDFDNGVSFVLDNLCASTGETFSQEWLKNVNAQVSEMCDAMISEAEKRPNTDMDHLQGWINEIWHKYTFNTNASIHMSGNSASIPSAEGYASVDNLITDRHGKTIASFSLKSDKTASASYRDQAETPWETYCELKGNAKKNGKEYQSFEDFLKERGLKNDDTVYLSKYFGQGKVVNSDMLEKARELVFKQYANALGDGTSKELSLKAQRYLEVYNTLTNIISDGKGNESISLTHEQAMKLATSAKQGKIDEELLKECGLDVNSLITPKDIAKEAFTAGLSAAAISMIISVVPTIIDVVSKLIHDEGITVNDFKKYGLKSLTDTGRSFLNGSITAAITSCCKTGKFGEALVNANTMAISSLVVVVIGTVISGIELAAGKITRGQMARDIMQLYTTTIFSFVGGTVLTCICDGFPLAYMAGSLIGGIVGGLVYKLEDHLILSFCKEHDCTFFGLVEQDYKLPEGVLEEMGLDEFGFEKINIEKFEANKFEPDRFNYDSFKYDKFGIEILRRDLIGVYKIGYTK